MIAVSPAAAAAELLLFCCVVGTIIETTGRDVLPEESVDSEEFIVMIGREGFPATNGAFSAWARGLLAWRVLLREDASSSLIGDKRKVTGTSETPPPGVAYSAGAFANWTGKGEGEEKMAVKSDQVTFCFPPLNQLTCWVINATPAAAVVG